MTLDGDIDLRPYLIAFLRETGCDVSMAQSPSRPDDSSIIRIVWCGRPWLSFRPPTPEATFTALLSAAQRRVGRPLGKLDRQQRHEVIVFMCAHGALELREAVDRLSSSLGVSKGTVYGVIRSWRVREDVGPL